MGECGTCLLSGITPLERLLNRVDEEKDERVAIRLSALALQAVN
jgi:hypothetical protein